MAHTHSAACYGTRRIDRPGTSLFDAPHHRTPLYDREADTQRRPLYVRPSLEDRLRLRELDRLGIDGDVDVQLRPDARVDGSPRVQLNRESVVTNPIPPQRAGRAEWVPPVYRYQEHDGRYFRVLERDGYWR